MDKNKILQEIKQWYDDVEKRYHNRKEGEWTEEQFRMDNLFAELAERISKIESYESEES